MKKTKKALASLAIAGMALTMVPFNAFATGTVPTRLGGTTAEQTAVQIAEQMAPTSGIAILASSASYGASDALTAGPLAAFTKAPILLQGPEAVLNADTKAELTKLKVTKVYVTSGTAVIKQAVLDQLSGMGITVESLGGADRFETSVNIAKKLVALGAPVKKVAVAYGWLNQDALSIAAVASAANEPIILTEKAGLSASAKAFLAANLGITASDVIGGTGVIDASVLAQLPNATRHSGATAYDTNNQVIQDFASSLKFDNVYVANGKTGIDALAGAPLAAMTNSPIVLTDGTVPAAATFVHGKMTDTGVVTALGGTAVVSDAVLTGVKTGVVTPPQGALSVTSVSATAVNTIKVVFNQAPADTSKVKATVTMGTTATTVSPSWNAAKTELTLTSSANYATGDYIVKVTNDSTDLGSSTVTFTAQRIGKIAITSNVLAVTSSGSIGYAGYQVLDQYGVDITTNYLSSDSNIKWTCGIGNVTSDKGLLTVTPFSTSSVLTQYTTAVVTANTNGQSIPASASTTLNVSTTQGTISDLTLNKLTSADNAIPTIGDSEKYYVDYSAKDMGGIDTKNLTLMRSGLISQHVSTASVNADDYGLITSNNSLVTAKIVPDPSDDKKAAIEVSILDSSANYQQDQPITITVSTYTGKTATLTFTLRRKQQVDSFTLMAPTSNVPSGKTGVVIPFTAVDQSGKQLTKYSDLNAGRLTLTPAGDAGGTVGLYLEENADGTAALKYNAPDIGSATQAQQQTLSASVISSGKFSTININVDLVQKVDSLKLNDSVVVPNMAPGALQKLDFGFNDGGLQVLDQYGAVIDMTSKYNHVGTDTTTKYFVKATSSSASVVIPDANSFAYAGHEIFLNSGSTAGSATITFKVYKTTDATIDAVSGNNTDMGISKSMSFNVIAEKDITGYVLDAVAKPLYAIGTTSGAFTPQQVDFDEPQEPIVYGTTSAGSKVVLNSANVLAPTVSSTDFTATFDSTGNSDKNNMIAIGARSFTDSAKKGSSATLTVTVMNGNDNRPHSATTAITSITDDAAAQSVGFTAQTVDRSDTVNKTGITVDGSTVTVDLTGVQSYYSDAKSNTSANFNAIKGTTYSSISVLNAIAGRDMTRFTAGTGVSSNRGYVYLWAKDQYGSKAMDLSTIRVSETDMTVSHAVPTITNNVLTFDKAPMAGDAFYVSGISSNGLVTTVKIVFK
jgi:putative cell wall-binding protein